MKKKKAGRILAIFVVVCMLGGCGLTDMFEKDAGADEFFAPEEDTEEEAEEWEEEKAESVKLAARQVSGLAEQLLADVVAHLVSGVHGPVIGGHVELAAYQGGGKHDQSPQNSQAKLALGRHVVNNMLQNIGQQQFAECGEELDDNADSDGLLVAAHGTEDQLHSCPPPLMISFWFSLAGNRENVKVPNK